MFDVERKRLLSLCHHTTLMLRPTGCHVTVCNGALRAHTCLRQSGQTIWAARPGFILKCLSFLLLAPFHGHCTVPLPYGRPFLARTSRLPSWAFALAVCNQCSLCSSTRSCTRRPMHLTPHVTSTAKSLYLSVSSNAPSDSNRRWAACGVRVNRCVTFLDRTLLHARKGDVRPPTQAHSASTLGELIGSLTIPCCG